MLVLELKGGEHVSNVLRDGLDITIAGDNDFYSQRAKVFSKTHFYFLQLILTLKSWASWA